MNSVILASFSKNKSTVIRNMILTESTNKTSKTTIFKNKKELGQALNQYFHIPSEIIYYALDKLGVLQDTWS